MLDYDAVEGAGTVSARRIYIEAVGSEADEKVGRGWHCPSILIGGRQNDRNGSFCASLPAGALLLDHDAVEGRGAVPPCRQCIKAAGSEGDEEVGRYVGWAVRSCWTTTPWRGDGRCPAS